MMASVSVCVRGVLCVCACAVTMLCAYRGGTGVSRPPALVYRRPHARFSWRCVRASRPFYPVGGPLCCFFLLCSVEIVCGHVVLSAKLRRARFHM